MGKGLTFLSLKCCSLRSQDLQYLAQSIHVNTLIELHLNDNYKIGKDSEGLGLITLGQKLNNVKEEEDVHESESHNFCLA